MEQKESHLEILKRLRYEALPDLVGTTVLITDLAKLEEDLIKALKPLICEVEGLWEYDKHWIFGTNLPMFWRDRRFQVSLRLNNSRQVEICSQKDLINLGFADLDDDGVMRSLHSESKFWNSIAEKLNKDEVNSFLHLFLSFSNNRIERWCDVWKRSPNYEIELKESEKAFGLMQDRKYKELEGVRLYSLELGKRFFPKNMFILNACLTNLPTSEIWQYHKGK